MGGKLVAPLLPVGLFVFVARAKLCNFPSSILSERFLYSIFVIKATLVMIFDNCCICKCNVSFLKGL